VNVSVRLVSLALLIAAWYAGSQLAGVPGCDEERELAAGTFYRPPAGE